MTDPTGTKWSTKDELDEYYIGSDSTDDSGHWVYVAHQPCEIEIFSGEHHSGLFTVADLLDLIRQHDCDPSGRDT